ncbi:MAG: hypothetical protein ACOY99_03375 [Pseudomonadota bacterium]
MKTSIILRLAFSAVAISALTFVAWTFEKNLSERHVTSPDPLLHRAAETRQECARGYQGEGAEGKRQSEAETQARARTKPREPLPAERLGISIRISSL